MLHRRPVLLIETYSRVPCPERQVLEEDWARYSSALPWRAVYQWGPGPLPEVTYYTELGSAWAMVPELHRRRFAVYIWSEGHHLHPECWTEDGHRPWSSPGLIYLPPGTALTPQTPLRPCSCALRSAPCLEVQRQLAPRHPLPQGWRYLPGLTLAIPPDTRVCTCGGLPGCRCLPVAPEVIAAGGEEIGVGWSRWPGEVIPGPGLWRRPPTPGWNRPLVHYLDYTGMVPPDLAGQYVPRAAGISYRHWAPPDLEALRGPGEADPVSDALAILRAEGGYVLWGCQPSQTLPEWAVRPTITVAMHPSGTGGWVGLPDPRAAPPPQPVTPAVGAPVTTMETWHTSPLAVLLRNLWIQLDQTPTDQQLAILIDHPSCYYWEPTWLEAWTLPLPPVPGPARLPLPTRPYRRDLGAITQDLHTDPRARPLL